MVMVELGSAWAIEVITVFDTRSFDVESCEAKSFEAGWEVLIIA